MRLALTSKVAVLTGGPGCGESFTVKSIITLAEAKKAKIVLAAPTGRAAKRLTELTGHPAATVHRLLQLRPGGEAGRKRRIAYLLNAIDHGQAKRVLRCTAKVPQRLGLQRG